MQAEREGQEERRGREEVMEAILVLQRAIDDSQAEMAEAKEAAQQ